ncbi:tRNA (adenosine(37)-N6)-dimethylallyltransferase MiaA [Roseitalea sp. MMSF_3546]|uniref:tRNA (adenosine(37)-N6)-dimethylallyltransferase MiaA n=1 Tax=Roseitalea sp. MMSF_3546 TaxID=3046724 RepID=UPI00273F1CBA|nr:tRNA (adenosine(37)-N6)-dimethylallyltransferase MiaA [Roseitalea sp. MMSF_3546]
MRSITLIAGPTASGKSRHALALAERSGAHIVNADAMQVYDVLRIVTARPDGRALTRVPHHLYGHVSPAVAYSTGRWARDVAALLADLPADLPLVFVGGTGLYFRALTEGLSPIPHVPADLRARWRATLAERGAPALHALLASRAPGVAATLEPGDGQRIVRALEVLEATGRSIAQWQSRAGTAVIDRAAIATRHLLLPERSELHRRIAARAAAMIESGGIEEVQRLRAMRLDPNLPAMKAIGVRELGSLADGHIDRTEALARLTASTRQYAKRQMSWWRNQGGSDWQVVMAGEPPTASSPPCPG